MSHAFHSHLVSRAPPASAALGTRGFCIVAALRGMRCHSCGDARGPRRLTVTPASSLTDQVGDGELVRVHAHDARGSQPSRSSCSARHTRRRSPTASPPRPSPAPRTATRSSTASTHAERYRERPSSRCGPPRNSPSSTATRRTRASILAYENQVVPAGTAARRCRRWRPSSSPSRPPTVRRSRISTSASRARHPARRCSTTGPRACAPARIRSSSTTPRRRRTAGARTSSSVWSTSASRRSRRPRAELAAVAGPPDLRVRADRPDRASRSCTT